MALAISDNFDFVEVLVSEFNPSKISVYIRNTDGDVFSYKFGQWDHHTPEVGTQEHTDWLIVQDTWALNNGFLDENGDAITFYVGRNPAGFELTPQEHEARGYYNPFREGSYEAYVNRLEIDGALVTDGSLERDATTGHPTIGLKVRSRLRGVDRQAQPSPRRYPPGHSAIQTTIYVGSG